MRTRKPTPKPFMPLRLRLFLNKNLEQISIDNKGETNQLATLIAMESQPSNFHQHLVTIIKALRFELKKSKNKNQKSIEFYESILNKAWSKAKEVETDHPKYVEILLGYSDYINTSDCKKTKLHALAEKKPADEPLNVDDQQIIQQMITNGADLLLENTQLNPPLFTAIDHNNTSFLATALKHVNVTNIQAKDGYTALMYAACEGKIAIMHLLLNYNANVNLLDIEVQETALHIALRGEEWDYSNPHLAKRAFNIIKRLISSANINVINVDGHTPLDLAYQSNLDIKIIHYLKKYGAKTASAINSSTHEHSSSLFGNASYGEDTDDENTDDAFKLDSTTNQYDNLFGSP